MYKFENQFPSLKDSFTSNGQVGLNITAVKKHCVDKQKIKEVLTKHIGTTNVTDDILQQIEDDLELYKYEVKK